MVENNVESVREKGRYLETIINRKKRTIPIASIEYVESRGRKILVSLVRFRLWAFFYTENVFVRKTNIHNTKKLVKK